MAFIVKSGNGKGVCGHNHRTVMGAMACKRHIIQMALREEAMKWTHARVVDEETGKLLREKRTVYIETAPVMESVPAM